MVALERTGARLFVERLRLEWRSGTPVPEPSTRLAFRPVAGREELVDIMAQVLEGTLDAHSRQDLGRMSAERTPAGQILAALDGFARQRLVRRARGQPYGRETESPGADPSCG